jgi:hypothetical protein
MAKETSLEDKTTDKSTCEILDTILGGLIIGTAASRKGLK